MGVASILAARSIVVLAFGERKADPVARSLRGPITAEVPGSLLQTVPGIGKILSLVLLSEMHDIARFPRVQDFGSYCRVVKCAKESTGKRYGTSGTKSGHA